MIQVHSTNIENAASAPDITIPKTFALNSDSKTFMSKKIHILRFYIFTTKVPYSKKMQGWNNTAICAQNN